MSETSNSYKIVVVGSSGVGKTAILDRLVCKEFREVIPLTIGIDIQTYNLQTDKENIKLQMLDTAGRKVFRPIYKEYFRDALGAVLVFDLSQRQSFDELNMWINDLNSLCSPNAYIVLVGNKNDLADDRQISETEAQEFAKRYNIIYLETSAKTGENVEETFSRLGQGILKQIRPDDIKPKTPPQTSDIDSESNPKTLE